MESLPSTSSDFRKTVVWAFVFIAVSGLIYLNTMKAPIIWDDITLLADNEPLRNLRSIGRIFVDPKLFSHEPAGAMYRPITLGSFVINYAIAGWNPVGLRIVNVIIHALNALLLMLLLEALLNIPRAGQECPAYHWPSHGKTNSFYLTASIALIWLVHPAHTEAIDHVSSRSVLFVTFFYLAATLFFIKWKRNNANNLCVWLMLACFVLGLMSKEIAITFPAMMLFIDASTPGERRRTWPGHAANFLMAAVYFAFRAVLFGKPLGGNYVRPISVNLLTQSRVSLSYLGKLFYPFRLNVCPDFSLSTGFSDLWAVVSIIIIMALIGWAVVCRSKYPLISLAIFWFFVALAPSSLIPLKRIVNEHNIYLPSVGYAIALLFLGVHLQNFRPRLRLALFFLMAISFASTTVARNRAWQAEENLWRASIRFAPHTILPRVHLGNIYYNSGRFAGGICVYRTLSADEPETAIFRFRLGIGLFETRQFAEAEKSLREAIRLDPKLAEAYEYLGHVYLMTARPQEAVDEYQSVKQKGLSTPTVSHNLSLALVALGKSLQAQSGCEAARSYYEQAINEDPSNAEAKTLFQNCPPTAP